MKGGDDLEEVVVSSSTSGNKEESPFPRIEVFEVLAFAIASSPFSSGNKDF